MIDLILASGNLHKAEEFSALFSIDFINIKAAEQKIEVIEDGSNFYENAFKKAKSYYDFYKTPVMSDDSGLCVLALPDELGIHSARFGGEGLSDKDRAELLLDKVKNLDDKDAYFVCVLCFYLSPKEVFYFEGRVEGKINEIYRGETGFGYDPVFVPKNLDNGLTMAEMPEWKMNNSHRSKATEAAIKFFKERDCQKS